jgi:hypothetical protein
MSGPDRTRSIAPTVLWFVGILVAALFVLDGGIGAITSRLTARRESEEPAAGPVLGAQPAAVEQSPAKPVALVAARRDKILALEDHCLDGSPAQCKRWAMDGFYRAYGEAAAHKLGHPLRISWYGDSVIATDAIPGRLRTLVQGEIGDGGPGFVYIVPPHRFCDHEAVTRSSAGSWNTHAISTAQIADRLYGVGGSTAETEDGRATIKLASGTASQLELYYLAQPHGGSAMVSADGKLVAKVETRAAAKQAGYATAAVAGGAGKLDIAAQGRVRLFGIALENPSGGVVDNLGIVNVNAKSFASNDPAHFQAELAHRSADLVMIMIGANEAEWLGASERDTRDYADSYAKLLAEIRGARPDASCLVISPTDQAEGKDGSYLSRPVMPFLVAAQRKAAQRSGCAFYSTYDWMGGSGSAAKWFRKGMVSTDFQHLSRRGANAVSEALFRTLMTGYQKYATP